MHFIEISMIKLFNVRRHPRPLFQCFLPYLQHFETVETLEYQVTATLLCVHSGALLDTVKAPEVILPSFHSSFHKN